MAACTPRSGKGQRHAGLIERTVKTIVALAASPLEYQPGAYVDHQSKR